MNECEEENTCKNGRCQNTDGGFWCKCDAGFNPNEDMTECIGKFTNFCRALSVKTSSLFLELMIFIKMYENMFAIQQSNLVCVFKHSSLHLPNPLASTNVAALDMVPVGVTDDVPNIMLSIANTVRIQIPMNLENFVQLVKDTINMATSLMTALSFQMLVR